jgi:hypothetical protein
VFAADALAVITCVAQALFDALAVRSWRRVLQAIAQLTLAVP